jgi:Co/Zn/Cd efflux system component
VSVCCEAPLIDARAGDDLRSRQRRVLWMVLAINATMLVIEMITSWYAGSTPHFPTPPSWGGIGVLALAANTGSAVLLYWHRGDDLNMRSVWLCSRNDAITNIAVILAAGAVAVSASAWPDLAAGALIAGLELSAAASITRQALAELREVKTRLPA